MKTLIASLAAVAALTAVAGPAAAQSYGYDRGYGHEQYRGDRGHDRYGSINARQEQIERQIRRGLRNGSLTPREASRLQSESRDIARIEWRARSNGLSRWERAELDRRLDRLEARLRHERRDDDRWDRYGRNDHSDRRW